jgi:SAM-dependent methyltransferase
MCGIRRHSVPLSKQGYEVVGFDLSRLYLNRAERWARKERLSPRKVRFYEGDSRDAVKLLSNHNETGFDAIINMYTSHGYFGEEEDLRLFQELRKISARKCLLVIETANRDFLVRHFEQFGFWDTSRKSEWHETRKFNPETSSLENDWKFYTRTGKKGLKLVLQVPVNLRVYSLHELKRVLKEAGWKLLRSYGDFRLGPLTYDSRHMILVSQGS